MAVGTVPVLQYSSYYFPPLRHGEQCITFGDERELFGAVDSILSGAFTERLPQMRASTRAYFEAHLSPAAFKASLSEFMAGSRRAGRLMVSQNTLSVGLLEAALQAARGDRQDYGRGRAGYAAV